MSNITAIVAPTAQQLTDYMNAAAKVNLYAFAITQTSLPSLKQPPPHYSDFLASFDPAKAHCLSWSGNIFPTVLSLPQSIAGLMNDMFNMEDSAAGIALQTLVNDPTNQQAKTTLSAAITGLQTLVQGPLTTAQDLMAQLNSFSTEITGDATTLNTIASQALAMAGTDQQTIVSINGQIDDLNNQISSLNTLLAVSEIGIGVSFFIGLIGVVVCFIPGAQVAGGALIVIGVLGEAASITGTVLTNKLINADQASISSLQSEVQNLNQDIIALQACNKQFGWLQQANQDAQQALQIVINMWQQLDTELTTVKTDLADVNTDATSAQYAQAIADLNSANTAWQGVVQFAQALAGVDYKWQDQNGNWHSFSDTSNPVTADNASVAQLAQAQAA
ncbi:MAG TPA: HBL/NHE enterotoxin family protein [Pyrinomonadaceae bacterium]|nr:HBL/NHE enterotoxin family protein [Pyrinomonadaceae bacterium]